MTVTINRETDSNLLEKFKLKAQREGDLFQITTEEENEEALAVAQMLDHKPDLSLEESEFLELLVDSIEKFETENYPFEVQSTPLSRLLFLMEAHCLSHTDIMEAFGSEEITLEVINGKREISEEASVKLGERFCLKPTSFLE